MDKVVGNEERWRAAVVSEVHSWKKTAYHPEGEIKAIRDGDGKIVDAGGVDCGKLIYCVYYNVGLIPKLDIPHYPPDWMMHQGEERFLKIIMPWGRIIPEEEVKPGDVVMYRIGRLWSHGGIIVDPGWPHIVHAKLEAKAVVLDLGNQGRQAKYKRTFITYW